jgi:hypothetical protein
MTTQMEQRPPDGRVTVRSSLNKLSQGQRQLLDRKVDEAPARYSDLTVLADANCDGFVAYLTPHSLYESSPAGSPRPAIDGEFKPAMDRLARSQANDRGSRRPVIIPLTHGLGDPRTQAPERVRKATGKDISSLWTPVTLDQSTTSITGPEAAAVARALLEALLAPGADLRTEGLIEVLVAATSVPTVAAWTRE